MIGKTISHYRILEKLPEYIGISGEVETGAISKIHTDKCKHNKH